MISNAATIAIFIIANRKKYLTQICRFGSLLMIYLHVNIYTSKCSGSLGLVTAIKLKAIRMRIVAMLLFQILQKKKRFFSEIYYHIKFHEPILSADTVAAAQKFTCSSLTVKKIKKRVRSSDSFW
jgi:hypothetical protein